MKLPNGFVVTFKPYIPLIAILTMACSANNQTSDLTTLYISDGSKQCHGGGLPLSHHLNLLKSNQIETLSSQCGVMTGMNYVAMCGAATGKIHIFEISSRDLKQAKELGFSDSAALTNGVGINATKCPKPREKGEPKRK